MKKAMALVVALLLSLLSGCGDHREEPSVPSPTQAGSVSDLGDDTASFGESLDDLQAYAGYFEEDVQDVTVTCVSGTPGCYTLENQVLTFTNIREDSVYAVSGKLKGSLVIDVEDAYRFDLELQGLSLISDQANPILVTGGDEVSITAKSGFQNYIYDLREQVPQTDETAYSGAIHASVDLEICGKGALTLVSEHNNGIHGKDDLQVKNLTLLVACMDNALKGNDSVEITGGNLTLIASQGDGIKTSNTDISDKGNQRGNVTIAGGTHTIYAACDGIDAACDVVISQDTTRVDIYTDKYSNYSSQVTAVEDDEYYIRFTGNQYQYSIKYYNSPEDCTWVNAQYHSEVAGGRYSYYYYAFPKLSQYEKMQFFIYDADMTQGQEGEYLACSEYLTPNTGYDTFALTSRGGSLSYDWTNYTTTITDMGFGGPGGHGGHGGFGGMGGGNPEKSEYSAKGVKAGNEIHLQAGTVNIKAYDDAIHANGNTALENGETATGNVTLSGGVVTLYSNDDGIHADGTLRVTGGTVAVTHSYEGVEGTQVVLAGGYVSVISSDDGINGTATSGTAVEIAGGTVYVRCTGDGIDSNSRESYRGLIFSGGNTVVISNSSGNSALDTERGYGYTGGRVVAIMPARGMTNEVTNCQNIREIGTGSTLNLQAEEYLSVTVEGEPVATIAIPDSLSAAVLYLGSASATLETAATCENPDANGVCWH